MQVIVKVSGFYGGRWHEAGAAPQEMREAVARAFLPPYGDQLSLPPANKTAAAKHVTAPGKGDEKKAD